MKEKDEKENEDIICKQLQNVSSCIRLDFKTEIRRKIQVMESKFTFICCNTHLVHDK